MAGVHIEDIFCGIMAKRIKHRNTKCSVKALFHRTEL